MFRKPSAVFGQLLKNHEDFENHSEVQTLISALLNRAVGIYIFPLAKVRRDVPASSGSIEIIPAVTFRPVTVTVGTSVGSY